MPCSKQTHSLLQAEAENQSLQNKLKLMEGDLEKAEDTTAETQERLKEAEARVEELERTNNSLKRELESVEGTYYILYILSIHTVCTLSSS